MKIRPIHDRVIVKRLEEDRKTASGIVIPDTAAEKPDTREVVAVGKGKSDRGRQGPSDVGEGGRQSLAREMLRTDRCRASEELLVMPEDDIMAVVENA
jgi:chaperonin GroES